MEIDDVLEKYRQMAIERVETDLNVPFNSKDITRLELALHDARPHILPQVEDQIRRDIAIRYSVHGCLAMWLDTKDGIAQYAKPQMLAIAKEFLGELPE